MAKKVNKKTAKKTAAKKTVKKKAVKKTVSKGSAKKAGKKSVKSTSAKTASKKKKTVKTKKKTAPKTSSKRTGVKKIKKRRPRSKLSAKDLAYFRELLIEKLKEILGSVNHIEAEALKTSRLDSTGDLSSMPIHMADLGSDNYEQEFALGLMDSERKIVNEISEALKRIENLSYGICEGTGEPIPKVRLKGIPWTRYCVQYAEMLEKGLVVEPDHEYYDEAEYEDLDESADGDERGLFYYGFEDEDEDEDAEDEIF